MGGGLVSVIGFRRGEGEFNLLNKKNQHGGGGLWGLKLPTAKRGGGGINLSKRKGRRKRERELPGFFVMNGNKAVRKIRKKGVLLRLRCNKFKIQLILGNKPNKHEKGKTTLAYTNNKRITRLGAKILEKVFVLS